MVIRDFFTRKLGDEMPKIHLLDIGASGGIDESFKVFGEEFFALGVEPLVSEVERLNRETDNDNIQYMDAFIEWAEWPEKYPEEEREQFILDFFKRLSASTALETKQENYQQKYYNGGEELVYSENRLAMDDLISRFPEHRIDFLKTDTDGFDFPILKSGQKIFSGQNILMAKVEAIFHSESNEYANNFANIDGYMRQMGMSLLDLETHNYSRGALPDRFVYTIPAQTRSGQILWGDALYFRDFSNPNFSKEWGWEPTRDEVIRLLMLLEKYEYHDIAVELLLNKQEILGLNKETELKTLLDQIVKSCRGTFADSYDGLMNKFNEDYTVFYPES